MAHRKVTRVNEHEITLINIAGMCMVGIISHRSKALKILGDVFEDAILATTGNTSWHKIHIRGEVGIRRGVIRVGRTVSAEVLIVEQCATAGLICSAAAAESAG